MTNAVDWTKIKMEYVTCGKSLSQLAKKYGLQRTTIARRSKAEGWEEQRGKYVTDLSQKCVRQAQADTMGAVERLAQSANKLMDKCDALLMLEDVVAPRDLKSITDTLMGVKSLLGIKDRDDSEDKSVLTVVWEDNPWD